MEIQLFIYRMAETVNEGATMELQYKTTVFIIEKKE